jgi:hypothetical protein
VSDKPHITIRVTPAAGKLGKFLAVSANGVGELFRDVIDLNSSTSRKRFVGGSMRVAFPNASPDDWPADVRADLEQQLAAFAKAPPGAPEPPPVPAEQAPIDPRVAALAGMSGEIRQEASRLLEDPKLLELVSADIEALGVVGEKKNRLLLYLTGVSAQLARPLAVITRGASSSGKSFVGEKVSLLFPPEVVLHATSLTTNALYYFQPGTLRHRFVIAGERSRVEDDDQAEATRALREMLESGRLSKAVPVKEGDRITTKVIEQEGPIAYVETTTRGNIFAEDANRCLLLNTDEGQGQTRRILDATATVATGQSHTDTARIVAIHHAIQRMLPRVEVAIPFASAIAAHYPDGRLESRRDFRHLLQLVKAVALLHFRQRDRGPDETVTAAFNDYAVAEQLARGPLGAAACGIGDGARKFLDQLREKFGEGEFTTTDAQKLGGASPRTLFGRLIELNGAGAIEQTAAPKGRVPAKWKLTGANPDAGDGVIPTVKQVMDTFSRCEHADNTEPTIRERHSSAIELLPATADKRRALSAVAGKSSTANKRRSQFGTYLLSACSQRENGMHTARGIDLSFISDTPVAIVPWDQQAALSLLDAANGLVERLGVSGTDPEIQAAAARCVEAHGVKDMAGLIEACRVMEERAKRLATVPQNQQPQQHPEDEK